MAQTRIWRPFWRLFRGAARGSGKATPDVEYEGVEELLDAVDARLGEIEQALARLEDRAVWFDLEVIFLRGDAVRGALQELEDVLLHDAVRRGRLDTASPPLPLHLGPEHQT